MCLWRAIPVLLLTETYSISDTIRCSELIFYFPCPALKLVISLRSPGFFYWRIFSNHNLGTGCHGHYWGFVASSIYQWTELRNICMYITHVYTHAHTFFPVFNHPNMASHCFWLILYHSFILVFLSCASVTSLSNTKPGSHHPTSIYVLICSTSYVCTVPLWKTKPNQNSICRQFHLHLGLEFSLKNTICQLLSSFSLHPLQCGMPYIWNSLRFIHHRLHSIWDPSPPILADVGLVCVC